MAVRLTFVFTGKSILFSVSRAWIDCKKD